MNNILSSDLNSADEIRACTSCQMCAAVCPVNAISIHLDSDGFYRPTVDNVKCVGCGFCRKVCYKYDREIKLTDEDFLAKTTLLAASAKDDAVVSDTTSGGIADLLAHKLIEEGYQCIGVVYDATHSSAYDLNIFNLILKMHSKSWFVPAERNDSRFLEPPAIFMQLIVF